MYSYSLSLTSTLDVVGGQRQAPAALPPGKTRYPLYRRLGGSHDRSGLAWKISPPTGIRSADRPARNESLYRLSYPGPLVLKMYWSEVQLCLVIASLFCYFQSCFMLSM